MVDPYLAPSYFAPDYFDGINSLAPSTPVPSRSPLLVVPSTYWVLFGPPSSPILNEVVLPDTFLAALHATLTLDPEVGPLIPGGFWNVKIPPNRRLPAGVYTVRSAPVEQIGALPFLQSGNLEIVVEARRREDSRRIADMVADLLIHQSPPLAWKGGHTTNMVMSTPVSPAPPERGYGSSKIFPETRTLAYQLQGYFSK